MNNPIKKIIDNDSVKQVLELLVRTNKFELESAAKNLTDKEVLQVGIWISKTLHTTGVQSALWFGGLLQIYRAATDDESRTELFQNMIEDLGISETKAYNCMSMWRAFGSLLLKEPNLVQQFPVESLKILAAKSAPQAARDAAIDLARNGERITIERANILLSEHAVADEQDAGGTGNRKQSTAKSRGSASQKRSKAPVKELWSYEGDVVRLVIEADKQTSIPDPLSIIRDLEGALEQFRRECEETENNSGRSDAA